MNSPRQKRVPLYDRLPQIYHVRDSEQSPPGQLQHYLASGETVFGEIHANIESLYHDLFIDTCDEWVIPYIGDLLGTSHLKGDPRTLRADVSDTISLRRRKGTLGAIERLTYNLTGWGVHSIELRENMRWNQHLNHQRPDAGGAPPYDNTDRFMPVRGGTIPVRDPALLSLLNTPFSPFTHTADVKPVVQQRRSTLVDRVRYNLPNLAIFLWRLAAYRVTVSPPVIRDVIDNSAGTGASFVVRADIHPLGEPVQLFNTSRFDPAVMPPVVSQLDQTPGPIPMARLSEASPAGAPEQYVSIETYDPARLADPELTLLERIDISETGLQLHLPEPAFTNRIWPSLDLPANLQWTIRGENLCGWEAGLARPLENNEVAVDASTGRLVVGVATEEEAEALSTGLLVTYTYGAVGPVGSHPISRSPIPDEWQGQAVAQQSVNFHNDPSGLQNALADIEEAEAPIVIEIQDSMLHPLDLSVIARPLEESGGPNLLINRSLIIRAADGQRPIVQLTQPLRIRPTRIFDPDQETQEEIDAIVSRLTVRLEGLYLTRGESFPESEPLIARAALHSLELVDCTLDPGGSQQLNGDRTPIQTALRLENFYGFIAGGNDENAFKQTPEIHLNRSVSGPLLIDTRYTLFLTESVLDAGKGVGETPEESFAVAGLGELPAARWGPLTVVSGLTVFGRMRVDEIRGKGGIWVHDLEVQNNQKGCLKFSYFSGVGDRLPQNHGCVTGNDARLRFRSEFFGQSAYAQLANTADFRIRDRGPGDNAMGAFGFLQEAHKWRNLLIRYREFMPVGIPPLPILVT
ncbi:MAG: hypothetical protein ACFB0D_15465 [Phormidesmis sp.]